MPAARFCFPQQFYWGTATSAHQYEGFNTNNWSDWEQNGRVLTRNISGQACDWWGGRWREDFDRAAETGQNTLRLSIEWSRLQPTANRWDEDALDHYRQMARGLQERGLMPMVTLHHFTNPLWVEMMGGWENEAVVQKFGEYARRVVEALHEFVSLWCTFNEPNTLAIYGYLLGNYPPGQQSYRVTAKVLQNLIKAHAQAYQVIHTIQPQAQVGLAHNYRGFSPAKQWFWPDAWATNSLFLAYNDTVPTTLTSGRFRFAGIRRNMPAAQNTQDFLGISYFTAESVAFHPLKSKELFGQRLFKPQAQLSPTEFIANESQSFFQALKWGRKFNLPIYITANGVEDADDDFRRQYLIQHIHQMWRGVNYTWPIKGYYHWSLVDNFDWDRGWNHRFGLWELDSQNQTRTKRKSAKLYEAICRENALTSAQVEDFAPEIFEQLFPGKDIIHISETIV